MTDHTARDPLALRIQLWLNRALQYGGMAFLLWFTGPYGFDLRLLAAVAALALVIAASALEERCRAKLARPQGDNRD